MISTLTRYCLIGGVMMSLSSLSVDDTMNHVKGLLNQTQKAVAASQERHVESFRPAELREWGNYLETPTLDEVYPGMKKLASIR
ncbi:MAG TPA: hypothetical protein EYN66_18560 [Myxococcales bacterium]|nr:hypothetical protein [Myxococcales bacterium]